MDVLNREGRFDNLLALRSPANQSAGTLLGEPLDIGSSTAGSLCILNVNSVSGSGSDEERPSMIFLVEGSNDRSQWNMAGGLQIEKPGLYRLAMGDRGFRYWRFNAQCSGSDVLINWSAFISAE